MLPSVIEENERKKLRCSNGRGFGHAPNTTFFEMLYARRFILDGTAEKMIFAAQTLAKPPGPSQPAIRMAMMAGRRSLHPPNLFIAF